MPLHQSGASPYWCKASPREALAYTSTVIEAAITHDADLKSDETDDPSFQLGLLLVRFVVSRSCRLLVVVGGHL
jgi:hypothetical protein